MIISNTPHRLAWQRYIYQTGATDKSNLLAFCDGIYDLGLWSNMVCWPLRSSQNFGTGTSVQSLGGLGSYNGAFGATAPTWGTSGMVKTAGNDATIYIPAIDVAAHGQWSLFGVANFTGYHDSQSWSLGTYSTSGNRTNGAAWMGLYTDGSSNNFRTMSSHMSGGVGYRYCDINGVATAIVGSGPRIFAGTGGVGTACNLSSYIDETVSSSAGGDGTAYVNGTGYDDGTGLKYGYLMGCQAAISNNFALTQSISAYFSTEVSPTVMGQIRTLYKETLGIGLNLP